MHQHAAHWLSQLGQWTDWASCHNKGFQEASSAESHWQSTWGFVAPLPALDSWEEGSSQTSTWELSGQRTGTQSSWQNQTLTGLCKGYVAVCFSVVCLCICCVSVWLSVLQMYWVQINLHTISLMIKWVDKLCYCTLSCQLQPSPLNTARYHLLQRSPPVPYELHESFDTDCIFDSMLDKQHIIAIYIHVLSIWTVWKRISVLNASWVTLYMQQCGQSLKCNQLGHSVCSS